MAPRKKKEAVERMDRCYDCDDNMGLKPQCEGCEYFDDTMVKHTGAGCPNYCSVFQCVIPDEECKEECRELKRTNSPICVLCKNEQTCSPERRLALLGKKYLDHVENSKETSLLRGMRKAKQEHEYLERRYQELKDDMHKIPAWQFWARKPIAAKGWAIRRRIEIIREVFDWLELEYEVNVEFVAKAENK